MNLKTTALLLLLAVLLISCGEKQEKPTGEITEYLPKTFPDVELTRADQIDTYNEESLWEYINGDAEIYLLYEFEQVANTYYRNEEMELSVDLYRFANSLNAYGIYSTLRPSNAEIIDLGVEGFSSPGMINFAKGDYLVRLFGYDESLQTGLMMVNLAEALAEKIPGTSTKPREFTMFPDSGKIVNTDDFVSELFLGQKFLTDFFKTDYLLKGDTVTVFLAHDTTGEKFLKWREYAENIKSKSNVPADIPFDREYAFQLSDSYYGDIVVGLKNGLLVGMAAYSQKQKEFLIDWVKSLQ